MPESESLQRIDALLETGLLPSPQIRKQLRITAGLTQEEVADAIGVQRLAVARWEAGATKPHRGNRLKYAHFLRQLAERYPDVALEVTGDG